MSKRFLYILFAWVMLAGLLSSCSKGSGGGSGGGGGGGGTTEADLVVTLNPAAGSVQPAAPQADFPLSVSITSAMPPQGVTIDVAVKKDDGTGAPAFFTTSLSTSSAVNNFTITGTPTGVVCITDVIVTSKTKAANKWTGNYRYSRKP